MANKSVVMASSFTAEAFESILVDVSDSVSDSGSWQVIDPSDSDDDNFSYGEVTTTDDDTDDVADVDDLLQHPYGSPASDISMQSLLDQITHHCQELNHAYETDHRREMIGDDEAVADVTDLLQHSYGSQSYDTSLKSLVNQINHHSQELAYGIDQGGEIIGDEEVVADVDKITYHCQELKHPNEIDQRLEIIGDAAAVKDGGSIGGGDDLYDEGDDAAVDSELDDELVPKWLNHKFERQRMRKLGKRGKKSKRMAYQNNRPGCVHGKHGLGLKHNLIW